MASRSLGTLTLDLVARVGGFTEGMDKAQRAADKRSKEIARSIDAAAKSAATFGKVMGATLAAGIALITRNTIQAEQELAQLDAILKSTGNAAGYSRDELVSMADELSKSSIFSGGDIIKAQTRLLSYSGVVGEVLPRAMQAIIDQSARLGMSLEQSAEGIGRALESPTKAAAALSQQGFGAAFTKEIKDTIAALEASGRSAEAQSIILDILEESYKGAAKAARDTFGGALTVLRNTFTDLLTGSNGNDGLRGATVAVNELTEVLNGEEVKNGFAAVTSGAITAVTWLAKFTAGVGGVTTYLSEEFASGFGNVAADDIVRLQERVVHLRRELMKPMVMRDLRLWDDEKIRDELKLRERQVRDFYKWSSEEAARANKGAAKAAPVLPADPVIGAEIQKQIDQIHEQADAYGLSKTALLELNRQKLLSVSTNQLERDSINQAYNALIGKMAAEERQSEALKKQEAIKSYIDNLQRQYDLLGLNAVEADEYALSILGANESQQKVVASLRESLTLREQEMELIRVLDDMMITHAEIITGVDSATRQYQATLSALNELYARGRMGQEEYEAAIARAQKQFDEMRNGGVRSAFDVEEAWLQASRNIQSSLADFLFDPFDQGLKGMLNGFVDILRRMAAEAAAAQIFESIAGLGKGGGGGGVLGWIGSLFGGEYANGGIAPGGKFSLVGERGPELIAPANAMRVYDAASTQRILGDVRPQGQMVVNNHFVIQAPQGTVSQATQSQVAASAQRGLARGSRNT